MTFDPYKYGAKPVTDSNFDPLQYGAKPVNNSNMPAGEPDEVKRSFMQKLGSFGLGALKGVGSTLVNSTDLIQRGGQKIADVVAGGQGTPTVKEFVREDAITPQNGAEKAGFMTEQIAEFFIPAGSATKVAKVVGGTKLITQLPAKIAAEAATGAGVVTAQGGNKSEIKNAAIVGGALPVAGKIASPIFKQIFQKLPKRLVQSVVGQSKAEKLAGKDVSEYVLKTRKVGTADQLIQGSSEAVNRLGNDIQKVLEATPKTKRILKNDILGQVAQKINKEGGEITTKEVSEILETLAPQIKSLLRRQSLSLTEGNRLRQALDKTLGDRGFLTSQLPYNKSILKSFDDILREKVKTLAPKGTREMFEEISKEITLRDALLAKYAGQSGNQILNAFDIIIAGGGGIFGGGIPGALGALAVKKAVQSPLVKTGTAQILDKSGKVLKKSKKLAPLVKGSATKASGSSSTDK